MKTGTTTMIHGQDPDGEAWIRHGDEMMNKGDTAKAFEYYDRAIASHSTLTRARAWHSKANALDSIGMLQDAIQCYDSALMCDPGDAECHFNKGLTLKKMGHDKEGASCIDSGVQIAMGHG